MALEISTKAAGRFAALLASDIRENAAHDRPLLETADWIVAPTLGAVIPNWTIVVPRQAALNFRDWMRSSHVDPVEIIADVTGMLAVEADRIIWFEHGPRAPKTEVGCGVDYAHLHILLDPPFSFDELIIQVKSMFDLEWREECSLSAYHGLSDDSSYLVVGSNDRVAVAEHVEHIGSQFLRRAVATVAGKADAWNYRAAPGHEILLSRWPIIERCVQLLTVSDKDPPETDAPASAKPQADCKDSGAAKAVDTYTDDRPKWDWESKYPPAARKQINGEAIFLASLLLVALVCAGTFLSIAGGDPHVFKVGTIDVNVSFRILAIFAAGWLGGTTFSIKWLIHSAAKGKWHLDRRYWRLLVPAIGGVYACVVMTLFGAGMFSGSADIKLAPLATTAALAFLVGYFSDGVSGLLSNVANAVFGTLEKK